MTETTMPIGEARTRLASLLDQVNRDNNRPAVILTRYGKPVGALVCIDEWRLVSDLAERYEDLTACVAADRAAAGSDGTTVSHEELVAELAREAEYAAIAEARAADPEWPAEQAEHRERLRRREEARVAAGI
jgi:prevent-host-death family protein